jgi:hypothetical protein
MNLQQLARKCLDACGAPEDALPHVLDILWTVRFQALKDAAAEIERLQADALRYRYIRAKGEPDAGLGYSPDWSHAKYDAAIDAAIAVSASEAERA